MLTITIRAEGAAFVDLPQLEVARILRNLAERIACGDEVDGGYTFDINGNRVGEWSLDAGR